MRLNGDVALVISGLRKWLGENAMMAYLAMMTARLIDLRRVLRPSPRHAHRSDATSTSTIAAGRIRALTARPPIAPTSPRCLSAWQPNPGRRSTYRRGNAVQTTGTTSVRAETACNLAKLPLERITRLISSIAASLGTCIIAIPLNSPLRGDR